MEAEMKFQANLEDVDMIAAGKAVHEQRKRKWGEKTMAKRMEKADRRKQNKELSIDEIISMPEIDEDFPSMLQLTMRDRRAFQEDDGIEI